MSSDQDLAVNGVRTRTEPRFGKDGSSTMQTIVTYYVGTHGPFTIMEDGATLNAASVKTKMNLQIQELRNLLG